ncbi:MAG: redoxin domain-containing protein [Chloroflexi bacterium]|nr:redoxin domain-containing protein [Chloroflexota bacterium]
MKPLPSIPFSKLTRKCARFLLAAIFMAVVAGCGSNDEPKPEPTITVDPALLQGALAVIDGVPISEAQWQQGRAYAEVMVRLLGEPGSIVDDQSAFESFVEDHFIVQEAEEQGHTLTAEQIDQEEARILFVAGRDQDHLQELFTDVGLTRQQWRQELNRALLASNYLEDIILADIPPGDTAMRRDAWLNDRKEALDVKILVEFAPTEGLMVGNLAPDFQVATLDGSTLALRDLRGQAVILNFWATWCGPCREEMPLLQQTYESYLERGVVVLGVDVGEGTEDVQAFVHDIGVTFPIGLDRDQTLSRRYRVFGLPTTFFIDQQGVINYVTAGAVRPTDLNRLLDVLADEGTGENQ